MLPIPPLFERLCFAALHSKLLENPKDDFLVALVSPLADVGDDLDEEDTAVGRWLIGTILIWGTRISNESIIQVIFFKPAAFWTCPFLLLYRLHPFFSRNCRSVYSTTKDRERRVWKCDRSWSKAFIRWAKEPDFRVLISCYWLSDSFLLRYSNGKMLRTTEAILTSNYLSLGIFWL